MNVFLGDLHMMGALRFKTAYLSLVLLLFCVVACHSNNGKNNSGANYKISPLAFGRMGTVPVKNLNAQYQIALFNNTHENLLINSSNITLNGLDGVLPSDVVDVSGCNVLQAGGSCLVVIKNSKIQDKISNGLFGSFAIKLHAINKSTKKEYLASTIVSYSDFSAQIDHPISYRSTGLSENFVAEGQNSALSIPIHFNKTIRDLQLKGANASFRYDLIGCGKSDNGIYHLISSGSYCTAVVNYVGHKNMHMKLQILGKVDNSSNLQVLFDQTFNSSTENVGYAILGSDEGSSILKANNKDEVTLILLNIGNVDISAVKLQGLTSHLELSDKTTCSEQNSVPAQDSCVFVFKSNGSVDKEETANLQVSYSFQNNMTNNIGYNITVIPDDQEIGKISITADGDFTGTMINDEKKVTVSVKNVGTLNVRDVWYKIPTITEMKVINNSCDQMTEFKPNDVCSYDLIYTPTELAEEHVADFIVGGNWRGGSTTDVAHVKYSAIAHVDYLEQDVNMLDFATNVGNAIVKTVHIKANLTEDDQVDHISIRARSSGAHDLDYEFVSDNYIRSDNTPLCAEDTVLKNGDVCHYNIKFSPKQIYAEDKGDIRVDYQINGKEDFDDVQLIAHATQNKGVILEYSEPKINGEIFGDGSPHYPYKLILGSEFNIEYVITNVGDKDADSVYLTLAIPTFYAVDKANTTCPALSGKVGTIAAGNSCILKLKLNDMLPDVVKQDLVLDVTKRFEISYKDSDGLIIIPQSLAKTYISGVPALVINSSVDDPTCNDLGICHTTVKFVANNAVSEEDIKVSLRDAGAAVVFSSHKCTISAPTKECSVTIDYPKVDNFEYSFIYDVSQGIIGFNNRFVIPATAIKH